MKNVLLNELIEICYCLSQGIIKNQSNHDPQTAGKPPVTCLSGAKFFQFDISIFKAKLFPVSSSFPFR